MGGMQMSIGIDRVADALEKIAASMENQSVRMTGLEKSLDWWKSEALRMTLKNQKLRKQIKQLGRKPIA